MTLQTQIFENLAITGMDAVWGGCDGLDAFERLVYTGSRPAAQANNGNGKAHPQDQEVLLAKVTRRALLDAGFDPDYPAQARIAALTAGTQTPLPGWNWAERVIDLSNEVNPLVSAVREAQRLLAASIVDAVVFAACSGSLSLHQAMPQLDEKTAFGFDRSIHDWRQGEGAGALVFTPQREALRVGKRVYAVLRTLAAVDGVLPDTPSSLPIPPALGDVRGCCKTAVAEAGILPSQIGYVEAFASGFDALDGIEIAGLVQAYRQPEQDLSTALGSAQTSLGYLGPASGLAALVHTALCLYHRFIPGAAGWSTPKLPALWRGAPFYVAVESRAWFKQALAPARMAGVSLPGLNGSYAHMILAEAVEQAYRPNQTFSQGGFYLFPLPGSSLDELTTQLDKLSQDLQPDADLLHLAAAYSEAAGQDRESLYALSIVGHNPVELNREIEMAQRALPAAFEKDGEWQTPAGQLLHFPAGRPFGWGSAGVPGRIQLLPRRGKRSAAPVSRPVPACCEGHYATWVPFSASGSYIRAACGALRKKNWPRWKPACWQTRLQC
jgi:hypothetical protein